MKRLVNFLRTTLVGGIMVVLPIAVIVILFIRAMRTVREALSPLKAYMPDQVFFPGLLAALVVLGGCFLCGLLVRTPLGAKLRRAIEKNIFERIPGYSMLRGLSGRIAGEDKGFNFKPAMAMTGDGLVPAYIVEENEDGSLTVYVPSAPTPAAGTILIMERERVFPVDVPFITSIKCVTRWGVGTGELLRAMHRH